MTTAEKLIKVTENREKLYEAGKKAEYDSFWDAAQKNGTRASYSYGFSGGCWTDKTFRPKYDIIAQPGNGIFQGNAVTDYVKLFSDCGVVFDTSKSNNNQYMFNGSFATRIPVIDLSADTTSQLTYVFNACRSLKSIEKVIFKQDGSQKFNQTFGGCTSLAEIRVEGVIGETISFGSSPLSKDSMRGEEITAERYAALPELVQANNTITLQGKIYWGGVIPALSVTATGKTIEFKKTAKEAAFTEEEWNELIALRPNWTFKMA